MLLFLVLSVLLSQVKAHFLPQLHYNTSTALIWKCSHSTILHHFTTVLHHDKDYQYIITSKDEQMSFNNNCTLYIDMKDHLTNEITTATVNHLIKKRDTSHPDWFQSYHNLSTIYHWYKELAATHSSRVSIKTIGNTLHGRNILAVHITKEQHSNNNNKNKNNKPVIYIQCLLHSREWITGPVCMSLTHLLATADSTNNIVFNLLDKVQFIIVPVANPDGYYLTWLNYPKYRFWRKNLSKNSRSSCLGVDLNRNFNIKWGKYGSSSDPCSDTYKGSSVESELEVQAITNYLTNYQQPVIGAIDLHSFSQAIIYPHAWTTSSPPNAKLLKYIAQRTAGAANHLGETYKIEQMSSIYLASGTFTDWLLSDEFVNKNKDSNKHKYNPFPLTIELPPTGDHSAHGFMVPPKQIPSICNGMNPAIIKFTSLVANNQNNARTNTR